MGWDFQGRLVFLGRKGPRGWSIKDGGHIKADAISVQRYLCMIV